MIPANLLRDIDNADPPELWDLLTILAEWLEECGDVRADGIRWLVEHRRKPVRKAKTCYFWVVDSPDAIFTYHLPSSKFGTSGTLICELRQWPQPAACLAAAQAFADALIAKQRMANRKCKLWLPGDPD